MKTISRKNIAGFVPDNAEFAQLNPTGEFIQKLYRLNEFGTVQYYGEQGGWHASSSFTKETINNSNSFLKII